MQLEKLTVDIRPRTPWEAIDIGFVLARRWYLKLGLLWLATAVPAIVLLLSLAWLLPGSTVKWTIFLFWLGKPVFEPLLLLWLSKAVFGTKNRVGDTLRELKADLNLRLVGRLLMLRISPTRSFSLPVTLLEKLKGKQRQARLQLLTSGYEPFFISVAIFFLELLLCLSLMTLLYWLIPENLRWMDFGSFVFRADNWVILAAYFLACAILAPFYLASGFTLYISRRVQLEAWDIEIGFKRMHQRLFRHNNGATTAMVVIGCLLSFSLSSLPCHAAPDTPEEAKTVIESVLEDKAFGEEVTRHHWVPKVKDEQPEDSAFLDFLEEFFTSLAEFLEETAPFIATFGKILIWCLAGIIIAIFLLKYSKIQTWLSGGLPQRGNGDQPPEILFGMDLRPESLPDDIAGSCYDMLQQGKSREALSLLYRGTLSLLINLHALNIRSSFTENECCREVHSNRPAPEATFFQTLTSTWMATAYGHRPPGQDRCRQLVENWHELYGETA